MTRLPKLPIDPAVSRMQARAEIKTMLSGGFPEELMERMCKASEPIGSFSTFEVFEGEDGNFSLDMYGDFQEFFTKSRISGLDGSVPNAYGGSGVASICGINPYSSAVEVYDRMTGSVPPVDEAVEDIFFAGHILEDVAKKFFIYKEAERYDIYNCRLQWHCKAYPHFLVNCDGLAVDRKTGELGVVEIKHTISDNIKTIKAFEEKNPPKYYVAQAMSYAKALDAGFVILILIYGTRPENTVWVRLERDDVAADRLLSECEDFIKFNIEGFSRPRLSKVKDFAVYRKMCEKIFGKEKEGKKPVVFDESGFGAGFKKYLAKEEEYRKAKEERLSAKKKEDRIKEELDNLTRPFIAELGDSQWGKISVEGKTYRLSYRGTGSLDLDKLKKDWPDVYEAFRKEDVNTGALKRARADVYNDCRIIKDNSRRFSFKEVTVKR